MSHRVWGTGKRVHLLGIRRRGTGSREHVLLPAGDGGRETDQPPHRPSNLGKESLSLGVAREALGAGVLRRVIGPFTQGERKTLGVQAPWAEATEGMSSATQRHSSWRFSTLSWPRLFLNWPWRGERGEGGVRGGSVSVSGG